MLAAVGGAVPLPVGHVDVFGWLALASFLGALGAEMYILANQPLRLWYEGRAGAESVKTLTWRYAVGGNPFPTSLTTAEADHLFLERLSLLLAGTLWTRWDRSRSTPERGTSPSMP